MSDPQSAPAALNLADRTVASGVEVLLAHPDEPRSAVNGPVAAFRWYVMQSHEDKPVVLVEQAPLSELAGVGSGNSIDGYPIHWIRAKVGFTVAHLPQLGPTTPIFERSASGAGDGWTEYQFQIEVVKQRAAAARELAQIKSSPSSDLQNNILQATIAAWSDAAEKALLEASADSPSGTDPRRRELLARCNAKAALVYDTMIEQRTARLTTTIAELGSQVYQFPATSADAVRAAIGSAPTTSAKSRPAPESTGQYL